MLINLLKFVKYSMHMDELLLLLLALLYVTVVQAYRDIVYGHANAADAVFSMERLSYA